MIIKDKRAFFVYLIISVVLWQFCVSLEKIFSDMAQKMVIFPSNSLIEIVPIVKNTGGAFGIFENITYLLAAFGVLVVAGIVYYVSKKVKFEDKFKILFLGIFTAGILGNTYERIAFSYVSDFIKINLFDFPVFNLFDILICTSVLFFILYFLNEELKKRKK